MHVTDPNRQNLTAVRARAALPLLGEPPARGMEALARPLASLDDAVIAAQGGVILAVEPYGDYMRRPGVPAPRDLGDVLLAPGLVNCHTHLEISHMAGKTHLGDGFVPWLQSLIALDRNPPEDARASLHEALRVMGACGTAAVGDISSRASPAVLGAAEDVGIAARVFCEVIGGATETACRAESLAASNPAFSLAGHAFYTTPGEAVARAHAWCATHARPFSLHLAEHADEVECLRDGKGALFDMVGKFLPSGWRAPGVSPVRHAASLGVLAPGTLAVHCVQCDKKDVAILADSGAAVCLCPRSNAAISVGEAPARSFAEQGILLGLGTDSLASNADLNVWHEAEFFWEKNTLPPNALLRMATINGAAILGLADRAGRLEKGRPFAYSVFPGHVLSSFHCAAG